jgi:hypothetical protein
MSSFFRLTLQCDEIQCSGEEEEKEEGGRRWMWMRRQGLW